MKSILIALTLAASVTLTRATITYAYLNETGDNGATNMTCSYDWSPAAGLGLVGTQWNVASANLYGQVTTDTPTDPALNLTESINNTTGIAWSDYHAQITMGQSFSFSNEGVTNSGWTFTVVQPTLVGTNYVGSVNYFAGTPVPNGGELGFSFTLNFTGSVNFNEQLTPSFVPEPSSIGLISCGLVLSLFRRRLAKL